MNVRNTKYSKALFIFRRDLRIHDNTGLIEACRNSVTVIPSFFIDSVLFDRNSTRCRPNLLQFMYESLKDLDSQLRSAGSGLFVFYGDDIYTEFERTIGLLGVDAVFLNEDYTPFSSRRDKKLEEICRKKGIGFESSFDLLLTRPGDVLNADGKPYRVFTWFMRNAANFDVRGEQNVKLNNLIRIGKDELDSRWIRQGLDRYQNDSLYQHGGRGNALEKLGRISEHPRYDEKRNIPSVRGTTELSAHIKFGTLSIREVYRRVREEIGDKSNIITQLYWRDFFTHLAYFNPHVFSGCYNEKYDSIVWENDTDKFERWCEGTTGFPIVDAGMRQLKTTGWMHNRLRMITASFLVKDLHVDWKWGERYFASKLVDYDPASNNGGWQWAASTGADAQPYFRIFNPWRQQERFDPEARYIRRYVPELSDADTSIIHKPLSREMSKSLNYPFPIVDHQSEVRKAKAAYSECG